MHNGERDALLRGGVEALQEIAKELRRANELREQDSEYTRKASQREMSNQVRFSGINSRGR